MKMDKKVSDEGTLYVPVTFNWLALDHFVLAWLDILHQKWQN